MLTLAPALCKALMKCSALWRKPSARVDVLLLFGNSLIQDVPLNLLVGAAGGVGTAAGAAAGVATCGGITPSADFGAPSRQLVVLTGFSSAVSAFLTCTVAPAAEEPAARPLSSTVIPVDGINEAPQSVLCPSKAAGFPSTMKVGSPSTILGLPCPLIGQVQASPSRATGLPSTIMRLDALITLPPWLVLSPNRMIALIALPRV